VNRSRFEQMTSGELRDGTTRSLISVLERAVSDLSQRVGSEHRFRFVSATQALPYSSAYAEWVKNGETGPPPPAAPAEMRAVIYSQAESASELRAFSKVASVAAVELAEAALAGLNAGQVIFTYTALRGFVERTAHASAIAVALRKIKDAPADGPLTSVLDLSEVIHKSLYATRRDWPKLIIPTFGRHRRRTCNTSKRKT
jgi:hypothetical protein